MQVADLDQDCIADWTGTDVPECVFCLKSGYKRILVEQIPEHIVNKREDMGEYKVTYTNITKGERETWTKERRDCLTLVETLAVNTPFFKSTGKLVLFSSDKKEREVVQK